MKKEEGHYALKRTDKLPKKGNANWLYTLKEDSMSTFYRWTTNENWEKIEIPLPTPSPTLSSTSELTNDGQNGTDPFITLLDIPDSLPASPLPPYSTLALMLADQVNQIAGYVYIAANKAYVKLATSTGVIGDYSLVTGTGVSGSGTVDTLPVFSPDGTTLGNSRVKHIGNQGVQVNNAQIPSQGVSFFDDPARWIRLFRNQSNFDLSLGNPDSSQESTISSGNYFGTLFRTGGFLRFLTGGTNGTLEALRLHANGAAQFIRATLASITNAAAGFLIFDSGNSNRPTIHNGTAWKALAYLGDVFSSLLLSVTTANTTPNKIWTDGIKTFFTTALGVNKALAFESTNLEIIDNTPSPLVASDNHTLIKTYDIGNLYGFKMLSFDIRAKRVGPANEAMFMEVRLKEVGSAVNYLLATTDNVHTSNWISMGRAISINQIDGTIEGFSNFHNKGYDLSNQLEATPPQTVHTIDFTKSYELEIYGAIGWGVNATWQTFLNIINKK